VFGPVWTALYLLMGISLYLVWGKKKTNLKWFWVQLTLNSTWSIVFFGLKNPLFAFVIIVLLWSSILLTIKAFKKVDKTAALLLVPYLIWVSFATILNLSIVVLNQ
jgi:tryptophan-rich sensory protein